MAAQSRERMHGSAARSNLNANVAESIFEDVAEDVDEEIVPANVGAWEEDDDVKSNLLNAFVTQTYNRNRRSNNGNRRAYSHIPSV